MAAKTREKADSTASPRTDAYTGMLVISLLATITGIAFLYKDYSEYPEGKPNVKSLSPLSGAAAPPAAKTPAPTPQPAPGAPGAAPTKPGP